MKQNISWKKVWKIYWYHYLQVSIYSCLLLLLILGSTLVVSHYCHFDLWALLKQPKYSVPLLSLFVLIQYFPINLYVLKYKTFRANFDGFRLSLEVDKRDDK